MGQWGLVLAWEKYTKPPKPYSSTVVCKQVLSIIYMAPKPAHIIIINQCRRQMFYFVKGNFNINVELDVDNVIYL